MGVILAIASRKGGCAKTSAAVTLAGVWAEEGKRVLVVDVDSQGSASRWLGVDDDGGELLAALVDGAELPSVATNIEGVELAPSGVRMANLDRALASTPGAEFVLREALEKVKGFDVIIVDCPPSLGASTVAALTAAQWVASPVAGAMSLDGLEEIRDLVALIRRRLNPALKWAGVFLAQGDPRTRLTRDIAALLAKTLPDDLLSSSVRSSVRMREAPSRRSWIGAYDPRGGVHRDYERVANELAERMTA